MRGHARMVQNMNRCRKRSPSSAASPLFVLQSNFLNQNLKFTTRQKWCIVSKHCSFATPETPIDTMCQFGVSFFMP